MNLYLTGNIPPLRHEMRGKITCSARHKVLILFEET